MKQLGPPAWQRPDMDLRIVVDLLVEVTGCDPAVAADIVDGIALHTRCRKGTHDCTVPAEDEPDGTG